MTKPYIWYSGATDITGKALAEALECDHGSTLPKNASTVIGWGTKTSDPVKFSSETVVLNHPDKIKANRDKLNALSKMLTAGVNVAPFVTNTADIGNETSKVKLPVIGRTKYHQGGKGFWMCPTITHVAAAVEAGANYFQNMIEIKDEYRLHTFGDKVIYAVKKVKRTVEEIEVAFIEDELARQKSLAEKAKETFDEKAIMPFLKRQAKKFAADGANMMIRSNRLGWKFVKVKVFDKALADQAVMACKALGLDFGAVDACIDANNKPWIIEVNTGPGLEGTTFKAYVDMFKEKLKEIGNSLSNKSKKADKITEQTKPIADMAKTKSTKTSLLEKVKLMREMAEVASEEEADVLESVFSKMLK